MGQRQDFLYKICMEQFGIGHHLKPSNTDLLSSKYSREIIKVYSYLNGQLTTPPTRFGNWDISLKDSIIELDEERHFNRYRLITLESDFYSDHTLLNRDIYKTYCINNEIDCLKAASWGKNWKNNSTEKQFGTSALLKDLSGNGSSRWKQRAFYDFLKDVSSKIIDVPILRVSIWERFGTNTINNILKQNQKLELKKYLEMKINNHVS